VISRCSLLRCCQRPNTNFAPSPRGGSRKTTHSSSSTFTVYKKSPKLVKPVQYAAPAIPETTVESWRMNEFKYYAIPSPFPTLARGLFSVKEENAEDRARYRIIARGYDKFFNIGEVPWTTVRFSSYCAHLSDPSFLLPVVVSGISHKTAIHSDAQV